MHPFAVHFALSNTVPWDEPCFNPGCVHSPPTSGENRHLFYNIFQLAFQEIPHCIIFFVYSYYMVRHMKQIMRNLKVQPIKCNSWASIGMIFPWSSMLISQCKDTQKFNTLNCLLGNRYSKSNWFQKMIAILVQVLSWLKFLHLKKKAN